MASSSRSCASPGSIAARKAAASGKPAAAQAACSAWDAASSRSAAAAALRSAAAAASAAFRAASPASAWAARAWRSALLDRAGLADRRRGRRLQGRGGGAFRRQVAAAVVAPRLRGGQGLGRGAGGEGRLGDLPLRPWPSSACAACNAACSLGRAAAAAVAAVRAARGAGLSPDQGRRDRASASAQASLRRGLPLFRQAERRLGLGRRPARRLLPRLGLARGGVQGIERRQGATLGLGGDRVVQAAADGAGLPRHQRRGQMRGLVLAAARRCAAATPSRAAAAASCATCSCRSAWSAATVAPAKGLDGAGQGIRRDQPAGGRLLGQPMTFLLGGQNLALAQRGLGALPDRRRRGLCRDGLRLPGGRRHQPGAAPASASAAACSASATAAIRSVSRAASVRAACAASSWAGASARAPSAAASRSDGGPGSGPSDLQLLLGKRARRRSASAVARRPPSRSARRARSRRARSAAMPGACRSSDCSVVRRLPRLGQALRGMAPRFVRRDGHGLRPPRP